MQATAPSHVTLTSSVERVTFHSEQNGYSVFHFATDDGRSVVVVGNFPSIQEGETLRITGERTTHPRFGDQFKASGYEITRPATINGILR